MAYTPYQDITFQIRYALSGAPQATQDGSGMVIWDIWSQTSTDGAAWTNDQHWNICVPAADLETRLVMADTTGAQKTTKNAALKALLVANNDTMPVPVTGKSSAEMLERVNANGRSAAAAAGIAAYLETTLNLSYPVPFAL